MRSRADLVLRLAASAAALSLCGVAAFRAYADAAYRSGLGYTDRPAEDVPGRLEAYEEAVRRDPRCFTYLLRAGQIHLSRAQAGGAGAGAHLESAAERLRAAADVHPLDARARIALAQLALARGRTIAARSEARRAFELGPRHPSVQAAAVTVCVGAWAGGGGVDGLRDALVLERARHAWQADVRVPAAVRAALAAESGRAVGDLLEACGGDDTLLEIAHGWAEASAPDIEPVLSAALRRARERR